MRLRTWQLGFHWIALAVACGCASAPGATMQQLQRRAWLDSGCAPSQLVLLHVDKRTKALEGCGQRLIYVESCEQIRGEYACTWVLNNPTYTRSQWQAPGQEGGGAGQPGMSSPVYRRPAATSFPPDVIPPPPVSNPLPSEYLPRQL